jgi:integrase
MRDKITKRSVDAAHRGERDAFLWDTELKGFGLKVTPLGGKIHVVQFRMGGRGSPTKRYTIGRHGSPWTAEEARAEALQVLREIEQGHDPSARPEPRKQDAIEHLVGEFLEKHHRARGNRSMAEVGRIFRKDVLPAWGKRPIDAITRRDVIELLDVIVDRGSPVQANRTLSAVRKLFNWAADRGVIEASPIVRIPKPGKETDRDRVLSEEEVRAVWRAADAVGWPFGPCVKLLILTAQRRDEVAEMRWSEIDLDGSTWTLPRERSKNDKAHEVPLAPLAVDILQSLPRRDDCDLVFSTNGRTPISGFSKMKRRIDRLSGVGLSAADAWVLHDLRRTVTTYLARMGIPPQVADKLLNHQQGTIRGVAAVYNRHGYLVERRAALDAWAQKVEDILRGNSGAESAAGCRTSAGLPVTGGDP